VATADLCLDPAPLNEFNNISTMNKIVEYMSAGKPIVAFDLLEHRRTALDAAYYVEPNVVGKFAAAVRELLQDTRRREQMSEFAKAHFHDVLAWEISESKLVRAYAELLQTEVSALSAVHCVH